MAKVKASFYRMSNEEARAMLEALRWPNGPVCPHCQSENVASLNGKTCRPGLKKCRDCRKQFTVTVGTIFESSHIPLSDWMFAFSAMCQSKKGISALQLQRQLELGSYESAWFMCHRIRHAMQTTGGLLKGDVEVDEAYVGGKPRKKNFNPGDNLPEKNNAVGRGTTKVPIVALVQRDGEVRTRVVADVTAKTLKQTIEMHVNKQESTLYTDDFGQYRTIGREFGGGHFTTKHSIGSYVGPNGEHSNTVESYFALIKRGVYGNFHHVSAKHLFRYCAEFEFRWNNRHGNDAYRTLEALKQTSGKRLMYKGTASNATV